MKKIFSLLLIASTLFACGLNSSKNKTTTNIQADTVVSVDNLLEKADQLVDKNIIVRGHVTHTCKHSGKRCFLLGDNEQFTIRVEAGGKITGFNRDLVGNTIIVKGLLKERQLSKEYIDQMEHEANEKVKEDGSAESCATEINNIKDMRAWMKANNKDHYSIYFVEGSEYELAE